jgi:hypothetical protein
MGDFLNSTNVTIGIVAGLVLIFGPIVVVLKRRQTALKTIDYQRPEVQREIRERWSVPGIIWRTWMGILFGLVFAVMFTVVPDFVINGFITVINNMQTDGFARMDFSNPIIFAICAIFGVSIGISAALTIAAPKRFARYTRQTSRSMFDPNNPWG